MIENNIDFNDEFDEENEENDSDAVWAEQSTAGFEQVEKDNANRVESIEDRATAGLSPSEKTAALELRSLLLGRSDFDKVEKSVNALVGKVSAESLVRIARAVNSMTEGDGVQVTAEATISSDGSNKTARFNIWTQPGSPAGVIVKSGPWVELTFSSNAAGEVTTSAAEHRHLQPSETLHPHAAMETIRRRVGAIAPQLPAMDLVPKK